MNRYFTKTFFRFFVAFLVIIAAAFGVLMFVASQEQGGLNSQYQIAQPGQ